MTVIGEQEKRCEGRQALLQEDCVGVLLPEEFLDTERICFPGKDFDDRVQSGTERKDVRLSAPSNSMPLGDEDGAGF